MWHDLIKNSITAHPSNNFKPLKTHELIGNLKKLPNLYAIVYCKRDEATYIFEDLRTLDVPVTNLTKINLKFFRWIDLLKSENMSEVPEFNEVYITKNNHE